MELDELKELNATDVVNEVGNLYSLGDDAIPILADHLEEMQTVQDKINDIVVTAQTAIDEMEKTNERMERVKQANTKLMYDSIQRQPKGDTESEKMNKLDGALDNINVYDD